MSLKKYSADYLEDCITVLGSAFVDNPLHCSAFGTGRMDQNRLFFRLGIRHMFVGESFVALDGDKVCGYVHFNSWPYCLPVPEEIPSVIATRLTPLGEAIPQVIRWFTRWCHLDPAESHVHLGPIGVAPEMQGRGIGTALMQRYVDYLEQKRTAGYLETDRPENVKFYKRFGFVVRQEESLIGAPIWYMWRPFSDRG
ncbi:MAG TPA: GNAT family N-acetyltransferase [Candidatus Binatia bacterium]|nr:GNAT family N-acetyltransferase [Candidatus Binatia bacterium]